MDPLTIKWRNADGSEDEAEITEATYELPEGATLLSEDGWTRQERRDDRLVYDRVVPGGDGAGPGGTQSVTADDERLRTESRSESPTGAGIGESKAVDAAAAGETPRSERLGQTGTPDD